MILQCDQCNTKFRLDDSKLKPGGVKVRCSKCRHVFVAGAEQKQEETEFDALLSGLGAPAPAKEEEAAPSPAEQQSGSELAALEFGAEAAKPEPEAPAAGEDEFGGFGFAPEPPAGPEAAATAAPPLGTERVDFGDINLETGTPVGKEEPSSAAGSDFGEIEFNEEPAAPARQAPAADTMDFGELSFEEVPTTPKEEPAPPAAADVLDFGELSFEEPAATPGETPASAPAAEALDFGEFSFDEAMVAPKEEQSPAAAADDLDFGDLSFEEAVAPKEEPAAPAADVLDFGELSFEEAVAAPKEEPAPAAADALDFGEFSFEEAVAAAKEETAPSAAPSAPDLGDFSFEEEGGAVQEEQTASAGAATLDFGDFSFDEEAPAAKEAAAPDAANEFELPAEEEKTEGARGVGQDEEFTFGEFSFPEEAEPQAAPPTEAAPAAAAAAGLAGAALFGAAEAKAPEAAAVPAPEEGATPAAKSSLDFSFGDRPIVGSVPEEGFYEELPPLSISSRRKGRSVFTIAIVAISVIVVLALSAAGLYLLQSGPDALKKLDKLGIGFVAKWFGMETPEEGRITIRNPLASFHQNKEAGELFVVTGEAVNSFRKPRASIQVKVSLFDKSGKVLLQKTAFCGNRLSSEQLSTLPLEKIESIMNNQFGDSLSNLGVKPDQAIGFVVAIANVPKEAADFGVEVVGSTVAAGQ